MTIALELPTQHDVMRLVAELDAFQMPLYPAESHHGVDLTTLAGPDALFAVARDDDGLAIGCGAILIKGAHGELKRFYTSPALRGRGVARSLLAFLEEQARARGCAEFVLETGNLQLGAIALYLRCGYERCGPFDQYVDDPHSVFMRKIVL